MRDTASSGKISSRVHQSLLVLFFASGACALIYEVAWARRLALLLGNTTFATSVILASFMAGLAIGSYAFGRLVDRKGRAVVLYAVLEAGIGLSALLIPHLLGEVTPSYVRVCNVLGSSTPVLKAFQSILSFLILLVPTVLMGGTLPVLSKLAAGRPGMVGRTVGTLYAANTLGGVTGCFLASFVFIASAGIANTERVAVITNLGVAAAAFVLALASRDSRTNLQDAADGRPRELQDPDNLSRESGRGSSGRNIVLLAIALSGFSGLAYEVLWTRILVYFSPAVTVHVFSAMLTVFLTGFAAGGFLGARKVDAPSGGREIFAGLQAGVAFFGILGTLVIPRLRSLGGAIESYIMAVSGTYWSNMALFLVFCTAIVFVPALFLGAAFPVAAGMYADDPKTLGRRIGRLYAANTVGSILGAVAAGFWLIPLLGTRKGLILIATVNLLTGFAVLLSSPGKGLVRIRATRAVASCLGATLCFGVVVGAWSGVGSFRKVFSKGNESVRLVYAEEGVGGTVTVERMPDYSRVLAINGVNVAGTDYKFRTTQKLQAHLPLLLHARPRDVLQIGLGSGETLWSVTRHGVEHIDSVELVPEIVDAARLFAGVNHHVLDQGGFTLTIDDVRSFLVSRSRQYDVILSDSIHPTIAGNGSLYTVEYFQLCRRRIKADGIFSTWMPIYELTLDDIRVVLRSMKKVFPYVYLWHTPAGRNEWAIAMGLNRPLTVDADAFTRRFGRPEVKADLAEVMIDDPRQLLSYFLWDDGEVSSLIGPNGPCNTDDNAYLEYRAARRFLGEGDRQQSVREILRLLLARRQTIVSRLTGASGDTRLEQYIRERDHVLAGRLLELRGEFYLAKREWQKALEISPRSETAGDMLGYSQIAKAILLKAAQEDRQDYRVYQQLGFLCLSGNDFPTAVQWFRKVIALRPDDILAQLGWSRACLELGRYEEALEHLKSVNRLGPIPWVAEKAKNEAELIYAKKLVQHLPWSADAQSRLASAYWSRGNYDLSLKVFEDAAALDPSSMEARINLGTRYEEVWELEKARAAFTGVLRYDGQNQAARAHLAELEEKVRYPDLIAYLTAQPVESRVAPAGRGTGMPEYEKALEYWTERRFVNATEKMEEASRYSSRYLQDLAHLYEIRGMYDQAMEVLRRVPEERDHGQGREGKRIIMRLRLLKDLRERPQTKEGEGRYRQLLNTLANVYWQGGEFEKAKEILKRLIDLDPHAAVLHANFGRCCESTGELPEAMASYRRAAALDPDLDFARKSLARLEDDMAHFGPRGLSEN